MKYVIDRIIEQLKAHQFIFNNFVDNCAVYKKMWKECCGARHAMAGNLSEGPRSAYE